MKFAYFLAVILLFTACKSSQPGVQLTGREARKIYSSALQNESANQTMHNTDSTFALVFLDEEPVAENTLRNFFVYDIEKRTILFNSEQKYHKARWVSPFEIELIHYSGAQRYDRQGRNQPASALNRYIYNVETGTLTNVTNTNKVQEK